MEQQCCPSACVPGDFQPFVSGRQYRDRLTPLADGAAAIDTIVFWLSVATCLLLAGTGRYVDVNLFFYSALAYLLDQCGNLRRLCGSL